MVNFSSNILKAEVKVKGPVRIHPTAHLLCHRLSAMATGFTAAGAHPKDVQTNPTLSERHVHLLLCK